MPNNRPNEGRGFPSTQLIDTFISPSFFFSFLSSTYPRYDGNPESISNHARGFNFNSPLLDKAIEFTSTYLRAFIHKFLHNAILRVIFRPERKTEMEKYRKATTPIDDSFQLELIDRQLPSPPTCCPLWIACIMSRGESQRRGRGSRRERNEERGSPR